MNPRTTTLLLALSALSAGAHAQGEFHVMPLAPFAPTNTPIAISADGNVVAGYVDGPVPYYVLQAYRYSIAGGFHFTGDVPGGLPDSVAGGISPDGVWVTGLSNDGGVSRKPFRWSASTGVQTLPLLPSAIGGAAGASSTDGSIIIGSVRYDGQFAQAVRWTPSGVEAITGIANVNNAADVSPDGQFVTGTHKVSLSTPDSAYRWSPSGGLQTLPFPPNVSIMNGRTISNDGSVIMGKATLINTANDHYFRWTAATGTVFIPDLPGRARALSSIWDMNADGSVAVGTSLSFISAQNPEPETAVIWTAQNGLRDLNVVAAQRGINLDGYHLDGAIGISDDGLVITGHAHRPNFSARGYILRLAPYTTGACCMTDGTCATGLTPPACAAAGGTSWVQGVACAAASCPPPGACCLPDGTCVMSQPAACAAAKGAFAGPGTPCGAANCPPGGACCAPDGTCSIMTASACAENAGLFRGAGTVCVAGGCPTPYVYAGGVVPIGDGSGSTGCGTQAVASVMVGDSFAVASADASIFVEHTYQGDLRFTLRHVETGRSVTMVDRPGVALDPFGFFQDNYGVNFSGIAVIPFRCSDAGAQVYDAPPMAQLSDGRYNVWGLWKPESPLAAFVGENSAGTWQLIAQDCAGGDTGRITGWTLNLGRYPLRPCDSDYNGDGDVGTDQDIEAFFACLGGSCCAACGPADFNNDGDVGTDADIASFFRVLGGGAC